MPKEPPFLPTPNTFGQALDRSISSGTASFLSPFMGLGSYLPDPVGPWFDKTKDQFTAYGNANRQSLRGYSEPGVTGYFKEAAANFPHFWLSLAPEVVNPVSKVSVPFAAAKQFPRAAQAATTYGPDALNTLYHGTRSYLDTEQMKDFFLGAGLHLGGEGLEKVVGGVAGNALGASSQLAVQESQQPPASDVLAYLYNMMGFNK